MRWGVSGRGAMATGWIVFVWLAVLTVGEYIVAVTMAMNPLLLVPIAILKAYLIVRYFMHIAAAWRQEGEGH